LGLVVFVEIGLESWGSVREIPVKDDEVQAHHDDTQNNGPPKMPERYTEE
jgi:hypothetical protein